MNNNYEVLENRYINDLNSDGILLKHKKTGAVVTILKNDDENKVFYIGFRTPPTDSTGVAHILEHSTLCGSKNFPVKDPFIELAKGSLNTFLNAMTYPDKTVYPIASCNDKDFYNLMHVYLDAVFYPNIYKESKIFKQEGWHYEITSKEEDITINGVVYNEMKGAFSSPDDVVETEIMKSLYEDSTYGIVSGGDPEAIPDLTYEDFLKFHGKFYHPSNSYIYLYGDMDIDKYLTFIDEEYLSKFDYLEMNTEVTKQLPFDEVHYIEKEYPVLSEDESEGTYLTYNISMGNALDKELYIALDVLNYIISGAPGAVVKQALLDAGIGYDVFSSVEGGIYQPYFSIVAKGASIDKRDEFVEIIERELKGLVKNGIAKKSLKASLNELEFKYRESDFGSYPRGLIIGLQALDSWLYDKNKPFMHIEANKTYEYLKNVIDEGYFEKLIDKYMINNTHKSILTVSPKAGLTAMKDEALKNKLKDFKKSLSDEQIEALIKETAELKEYQSTPSSDEDLKKIPMLAYEDLKKEAVTLTLEESEVEGIKLLFHDVFTNNISYVKLLFRINNLPERLIPYVGLLKAVIGLVDTKRYTYKDLFDEINMQTGDISYSYSTYTRNEDDDVYNSYFTVKTKLLYDRTKSALDLIREILFDSNYDAPKRLKELINETKSRMETSFVEQGNSIATIRAFSYFKEYAAFDDQIGGIKQLRFIQDLADNFDDKCDEIIASIKDVCAYIFRRENLLIDYTGTNEGLDLLKENIASITDNLYTCPIEANPYKPVVEKKNEGFLTAGQIQYVCRAGSFKKDGLKYTGALKVLKTILGYDYLWNNVRVLGGAYGCMSGFGSSGLCYFVSYRDPNLAETIKVYERAAEYISLLDLSDRDILKYIIGTLSSVDIPFTPSTRGDFALRCYLSGIDNEFLQKDRDEILNIDENTIRGLSAYIDAFMSYDALCVVGNADAINDNKDLFMHIEELI